MEERLLSALEKESIRFKDGKYTTAAGNTVKATAQEGTVLLLDALKAVSIPTVEVHISDVDSRESFRQISYAGLACCKTIKGHGLEGYREAILYLKALLGGKIA